MTTISGVSGNSAGNVLTSNGGSFGDNPFLVLLTTQLKNQTPLEPVDNASFMQQMASYSSMTQQQDLNANMLKLLDYQGLLARMQGLSEGSALLGKQVTFDTDTAKDVTGTVKSVYIDKNGEVRLTMQDDTDIGMRQVTAIANPSNSTPPAS
jgi:flagellar basal-body rod modification protein FlgD